jgi:hypothetical protein
VLFPNLCKQSNYLSLSEFSPYLGTQPGGTFSHMSI